MNVETFRLPPELEVAIENILKRKFALSFSDSKVIASAILRLSQVYTDKELTVETPWREKFCQVAYLSYYLPLNYLRNLAVVREGKRLGFFGTNNFTHLQDFGAGLGSSTLALCHEGILKGHSLSDLEQSPEALSLLNEIRKELGMSFRLDLNAKSETELAKPTLGIFSYSLAELSKPPAWMWECEALMIVEPSTREKSRKLIELRAELLQKGFSIWAPCTHELACPMSGISSDFCHDRIHVEIPAWLQDVEKHLPMRNRTLTFSYILAGKQKPLQNEKLARLVGDSLDEKGKTRQLICFDDSRVYLAWLKKYGKMQELPRGHRVKMPTDFEMKGNEMRVKSPVEVVEY